MIVFAVLKASRQLSRYRTIEQMDWIVQIEGEALLGGLLEKVDKQWNGGKVDLIESGLGSPSMALDGAFIIGY